MIRINLLAGQEPQRPENGLATRRPLWIISLGVILAAVIIGYWVLGSQIRSLEVERISLEKQTQGYSGLQHDIKELKAKKELAQNRLTLLTRLEKERHGPVRLLEQLTVALPVNQLWVTTLKETDSEIRLDGMSLSNQILADYMKRLETLDSISRVDLVQSGQVPYKDIKIKQFTINVLKKGAERPPTPVEKK
jgi:type IV pilus assembly protein PilN